MTANGWIQILFFFGAILAVTPPLGVFLYRVLEGESHFLRRPLGWLERLVLRASGVSGAEQTWQAYTLALLAFSAFTLLVTYAIQRLQHLLPFNPQKLGPVEAAQLLQHRGELHHEHELAGLRRRSDDELPHARWPASPGTTSSRRRPASRSQWLSPAASPGGAKAPASARSATSGSTSRGRPYTCSCPISLVFALVFVSQGMIQNLSPYAEATTLEGAKQVIAMGPVASQEVIKQLGHERRRLLQRERRPPVREPEPRHELPLDVPDLRDPGRADVHVRADGEGPAAGVGSLRRDGRPLLRRRDRGLLGGGAGQPDPDEPGRVGRPREHGGQGGPVRRRQLGPLRHGHDRRLLRRRQLDARQLHAARRPRAALQHPARRGRLRRRGRRPLRDAGDGDPVGVHRRA